MEISARCFNMPAGRINEKIEDAQLLIHECPGLDLSALRQWSEEAPRFLTVTHHLYSPSEGQSRAMHPEFAAREVFTPATRDTDPLDF